MQKACAVLYCRLRSVRLYHIFPHYLKRISEKVIEYKTRILIFSITCFWRISRSEKNSVRYFYKCLLVFTYSTRYSYNTLMNFFNKISINIQISNFMKVLPVSAELFLEDGQTDSQT